MRVFYLGSLYVLAIVTVTIAWARPAHAAIDIFMTVPELGACGESQDSQFSGAIDVLSFAFSGKNPVSPGAGAGAGRATISPLIINKFFDACSPLLFSATLLGKAFPALRLEARTTGTEPFVFLTILLEQVYVSDYASGSSSEDDRFTEQVMFTFAKITFTQRSLDAAGQPLAPVTICYDVSRNMSC